MALCVVGVERSQRDRKWQEFSLQFVASKLHEERRKFFDVKCRPIKIHK